MYRRRRRHRINRTANPRIQNIKTLANSPSLFYKEIFSCESQHIESSVRIIELIQNTPEHIKTDAQFYSHLGTALVNLLELKIADKPPGYFNRKSYHNYQYPSLISYCTKFIDDDAKSKVVDLILQHSCNFYSTAKKDLAGIATNFIEFDDKRAFDILRSFYRTIKPYDFNRLITKIPDGLENPNTKNVLSKTKLFDYLKYDEEKVNNDYNEKVKLLKAVAKTPTLIKRLPFILNVELKHLKEIAPAMRFKFMQFAFKYELQHSKYGWNVGSGLLNRIKQYKSRVKENKLVIEEINIEDMKELLFSVCLQKNDEFVKWIAGYEIYLACKNSSTKINVSQYKR